MKKIACFMICLMLLLTTTVSAYANETVIPPEGSGQVDNNENPSNNNQNNEDPNNGTSEGGQNNGNQSGSENEHQHSYTTFISDTASCGKDGIITYACSCGELKAETSKATGIHSLGNAEQLQAPTCKDIGLYGYRCKNCSYVEIIRELPTLTTHTYDSDCDAECNVCGNKRTIQHTFTTSWSKNYSSHWHECTKCGDKKDEAKHTPGAEATETSEQVCTVCGYVITPVKEHVHKFETTWSSDEVGHWYKCSGCKEEKSYASHVFDDACDADCNICSYKKELSHTYDDSWNTSKTEHWQVCTVCKEESEHEKHIPGEEATDEAAQICTVCAYELAPMLEHVHDFGTVWMQDQNTHWQKCKCGETSVPVEHVWDKGKENKDDTITFTCEECAFERTEVASSGFSWVVLILILLALVCIGGIVALVIILKRGNFDDTEEEDIAEALKELEDVTDMENTDQSEEFSSDDSFII